MLNLVERLGRLPSAAVSDVLRDLQTAYVLDPDIHSIVSGVRLAGPAFTVLARAGSIITVHQALLEAPPSTVLVVGGETGQSAHFALYGKLMAIQARLRGIAGVVVDGVVRDTVDLRELRFPVFARGATPHVGLNRVVGEIQVPVPCGGLIVHPGDYVVGDDDGIAIIPAAAVDQVVTATETKVRADEELVTRMQSGEKLADMIGFTKLIYPKK